MLTSHKHEIKYAGVHNYPICLKLNMHEFIINRALLNPIVKYCTACIIKQRDLIMHARQNSREGIFNLKPSPNPNLSPRWKHLNHWLAIVYVRYHSHNVHCHDHRSRGFRNEGKVRLWSIWYLICVTKHINSMVSPFLRVIYGVNYTTEITFIFRNIQRLHPLNSVWKCIPHVSNH